LIRHPSAALEETGDLVVVAQVLKLGLDLRTTIEYLGTAWVESTTRRQVNGVRRLSF
jgi:hypothetical protein